MPRMFYRLMLPLALLPVLGGAGFIQLRFSGWRTFEIPGIGVIPDPQSIPAELKDDIQDFATDPELVHFSLADALGKLDIRPGDVLNAHIETFTVKGSSDLGFLSAVEVWVVDGLRREKLAARYAVTPGQTSISLGLQDIDLVQYLDAEDPIVSVRVNGLPPTESVDIRADYTLKFGVSAQGACGAGRIMKDYEQTEDTGG